MRRSLISALAIVVGICTIAAAVGLVVGFTAELGVISGALRSGDTFDLVLIVEAAIVLAIVAVLFRSTKHPPPPRPALRPPPPPAPPPRPPPLPHWPGNPPVPPGHLPPPE